MTSRRNFIKSGCAAGCGVLAGSVLLTVLEGCSTVKVFNAAYVDGKLSVPVSEFTDTNLKIVRNSKFNGDILVVKKTDGTFNALYMQCTHNNYQLSANSKGLNCSAHGSIFDLDGNVTNGPAIKPLKKFTATIENNLITIS
jgi:nitrite reductase/ring-hydroxylating ferredoxin subunit